MYYKDLTWQKCSKSMLSQKGEKQISGIVFQLVFCWEWQGRQHCYIYYPSHFLQQVLLHCGLIETLSNLQHQAPPSHKRRLEHGVQTIPGRAACDLSVSVLRTSLTLHWKHHKPTQDPVKFCTIPEIPIELQQNRQHHCRSPTSFSGEAM